LSQGANLPPGQSALAGENFGYGRFITQFWQVFGGQIVVVHEFFQGGEGVTRRLRQVAAFIFLL
jgi:hypothetical protein